MSNFVVTWRRNTSNHRSVNARCSQPLPHFICTTHVKSAHNDSMQRSSFHRTLLTTLFLFGLSAMIILSDHWLGTLLSVGVYGILALFFYFLVKASIDGNWKYWGVGIVLAIFLGWFAMYRYSQLFSGFQLTPIETLLLGAPFFAAPMALGSLVCLLIVKQIQRFFGPLACIRLPGSVCWWRFVRPLPFSGRSASSRP